MPFPLFHFLVELIIGIEVNAGPIEIAKTFLGVNAIHHTPPAGSSGIQDDLQMLCASLKEFVVVCKFALKLNTTLIQPDQIPFQTECEASFLKLKDQVDQIIASTPGTTFYVPS